MATYATLSELFQGHVESATVRRLLLAGVEAFWRDSFHAASTRDIAKRAKLSPAAVYVHFKAKEDLLFDIIRYVAEHLRHHLRQVAAKGGNPTEMLKRLVHAYVAMPARTYKASLVANREFWSLTPSQQKQIVKIRDELEEIVGNCLAAGKASGEFKFAHLSVTRMAVVSLCRSTLLWYSPRGEFSPEEIGNYYVDLVLAMVGAKQVATEVEAAPRLRATH
jgi:AcrR family transcriptional regulator